MELPDLAWLLFLWTALFGAVLSYDVGEETTVPPKTTELPAEVTTEEDIDDDGGWVGDLPGFEFKVTQNGLNYAARIAIDTLMLKLMNLTIPDMRDEIGPASVGIHSVRVVEFPRPRSALRVLPQQGLRWRAKGLSPVIEANYEALISLGFWDVNKEGVMTIHGKNLQFALDFFVGRDLDGRPTITVFDCIARGDVALTFKGGWSDALNLGSRVFKRKIRSIILNQVCSNAKSEINEKTGWALSKFKLVEDIPPDFEIDFSLVRFPSFKNHSVHSFHKGAFYYKPNKQEPPFEPAPIPFFPKHRRKMVYVYITSYMLNTAFHALYDNNKLGVNVTSRRVPPHVKKYFASSCPNEICLGSLVPELARYYPTSDVALSVYATDAPRLSIDGGNIRLTGGLAAHIYAREGKRPVKILSVVMNVTGAVRVIVHNETVMFNVSDIKSQAEVTYSKMGATNSIRFIREYTEVLKHCPLAFARLAQPIPYSVHPVMGKGLAGFLQEVFENMVNTASKEFILPVLKDIGGTGFTLPELENMRLIKPTVINVNGLKDVLIIASDFEILPPE